jgi:hypothetical protein
MIQRLLNRLHRVFNKNPEAVTVIRIQTNPLTSEDTGLPLVNEDTGELITSDDFTAEGTIVISKTDLVIEGNGMARLNIDLTGMTIAQVVEAINNANLGYYATLMRPEMSGYLAQGLLEGEQSIADGIRYPTSLLYKEFQVYAWAAQEQVEQRQSAEKQLYPYTAEGSWQDYWFSFFNVYRLNGETDLAYMTRAIAEIVSPSTNNKALMKTISSAVGYYVDVRDLGVASFLPAPLPSTIGIYLYNGDINDLTAAEKQAIIGIVKKYKASGKAVKYFAPTGQLITNVAESVLNSADYVVGPAPSGWVEVDIT